jgi:hypothetical protein
MRDGLSNHIRWRRYGKGLEPLGQPDCGSITLENLNPKIGDFSLTPIRVALSDRFGRALAAVLLCFGNSILRNRRQSSLGWSSLSGNSENNAFI